MDFIAISITQKPQKRHPFFFAMIHASLRFCQEVKRLKRFFLCLLSFLLLAGCGLREENDNGFLVYTTKKQETLLYQDSAKARTEIRCCWLSYPELNPKRLTDETAYRDYLQTLFRPMQRLSITELFVQVRPFADAIYPTALFDPSAFVTGKRGAALPFDFLSVIIREAKTFGMSVHAWINPYRVLSDPKNLDTISAKTALGALIRTEPNALLTTADGVFLQPANESAQKLILDGVRELLHTYPLSGVHIDDYFYPSGVTTQDDAIYHAYLKQGGTLKKSDWRRLQITALVRALYRTVHAFDDKLVFSVSPGGNHAEDFTKQFADVEKWCSEDGCCDWMIPQIYFGFQHATLPFVRTAKQWRSLCKNKKIRLIGGLALYKDGSEDRFAGSGKDEWVQNDDVIARQTTALQQLGYDGFALYSAQFVNFQRKACQSLETVL